MTYTGCIFRCMKCSLMQCCIFFWIPNSELTSILQFINYFDVFQKTKICSLCMSKIVKIELEAQNRKDVFLNHHLHQVCDEPELKGHTGHLPSYCDNLSAGVGNFQIISLHCLPLLLNEMLNIL